VSGVLLAGLLLGEPITEMIVLALVLITAGILMVQLGHRSAVAAILNGRLR